jgi:hypothetical protein
MQNLIASGESWILLFLKLGLWLFLLIYLVFAATILKQIRIMNDTINTGFDLQLKIVGVVHFLSALSILVLSFIVL